jgi:hypothetical protein
MRTLLPAVALLLLVAPGCGDDTSSGNDMVVQVDMSVGADMQKYVCSSAFFCGSTKCLLTDPVAAANCVLMCAQPLDSTSAAKFGKLVGCVQQVCAPDGGPVDQSCALGAIQVMTATKPKGPCYDIYQMCTMDMG